MSLYTIAKIVFFISVGVIYLFTPDSRLLTVVAGVAALACAAFLVFGDRSTR